ncbi:CheR family methyltransferase [Desulfuribacillus alkaliarsenatis]|uniref:protein-glutamate O-methyltransferase n=1 Tax=Desulfuribacillus alkaliarsenatis TaxID=766136 RepID=A0A1E5G6A3_9FIRM|nr:protein-glutamate O-methyltransferase CheR [Desulfuribacillus alkaliarsenatis]OEF98710.1 chemotaxis protein CheR [Desulfuribacillus alkaliarsenatis]
MDDFKDFIKKVYKKSGLDLAQYKEPQMKRRLTSLYLKHGHKNFNEFFDAIDKDRKLYDEFLDRMTINVSEFYRNSNRWSILQEKILPNIIKTNSRPKVWSAACSTGEEPYTLAIILSELLPTSSVNVTATDIDESAISRAKNGVYVKRSLQEVPDQIVKKYFRETEQGYAISDDIKKRVTFKKHNLLADRFDTGYDLIVCRNVMIYFTDEAKDELYRKFSNSLRSGGVLFVGSTEQIFNPQSYNLKALDTFFYEKL